MKNLVYNLLTAFGFLLAGFYIGQYIPNKVTQDKYYQIGFKTGQSNPNKVAQEKYYKIGVHDGGLIMTDIVKHPSASLDKVIAKHYKYDWYLK